MLNLPSHVAPKKPLLTPAMIKKRLAFAKKYQNWSKKELSKVMFSDESSLLFFFFVRPGRVRRPQGSDHCDAQFTVNCMKHSDGVKV